MANVAIKFIENDKKEFVNVINQLRIMKSTTSQQELKVTIQSLEDAIVLYFDDDIKAALNELENSTRLYDMLPKNTDKYDWLYEIKMIILELYVKIYVDRDPKKALEYLEMIKNQVNIPKKTGTTEIRDYRHVVSSYYYMGLAHKNLNDIHSARGCYTAGVGMLKILIPRGWIVDLDMCLRLYYVAGKSFIGIDDSCSVLSYSAALDLFHKFFEKWKQGIRTVPITESTCKLCIANGEALLELFEKNGNVEGAKDLKSDIKFLYDLSKKCNKLSVNRHKGF